MCGVNGVGSPVVPLGLCAGGESAGAGQCTVSCPRRALREAHRSAVSVCRRGVRLASDFVVVVCALSLEKLIVSRGWVSAGSSPDARLVLCAARSNAHSSQEAQFLSGVVVELDHPSQIFLHV